MLFGPTGVGKTALLDRLFAGRAEVVSADALQVYRGMNIGTAKPDASLLNRLPHHLIDIIDPHEDFSVGEFCRLADAAVAEILSRGCLPVISGGTAFYLKAWLFGLPKIPKSDPSIRASVEHEWADASIDKLRSRLAEVDTLSAGRIGAGDRYRLMRALEVYQQTGRPLSSYPVPDTPRRDYSVLTVGLQRPRAELYERINSRVEQMFSEGLEHEVARLRQNGANSSDPGMKAIGYREWFHAPSQPADNEPAGQLSVVANPSTTTAEQRLERIQSLIARNSRRYAKRQITFFSSIPGVRWFDASRNPEEPGGIQEVIEQFLQK